MVEWAPGVTPRPDRVTLERHVEQLVEVGGTAADRGHQSLLQGLEGWRTLDCGTDLDTGPHPALSAPLKSVFKNYDPEGRGTISQEDFEHLSGNFPFACHGLHPPHSLE